MSIRSWRSLNNLTGCRQTNEGCRFETIDSRFLENSHFKRVSRIIDMFPLMNKLEADAASFDIFR